MRLNAYLARAGVASRRRADELIKAGRVTVNGEAGQLNTVVAAHDRVELDGEEVARQRLTYVLLHKPAGVVTTARDPQGRPTVVGLVPREPRVVPVGRLDADTTGALLLTNDGQLSHRLAHPRYGVEKTYVADVEGDPDEDALRRLREGIELEDGRTAPARADAGRGGTAQGSVTARTRPWPWPCTLTAHATRLPATESPMGDPGDVASTCRAPVVAFIASTWLPTAYTSVFPWTTSVSPAATAVDPILPPVAVE
jgi:16S rRNA U516 pseudouridylate synthase RsuA-like enzyme